ncbi:MAG: hypothetical protein ABI685_00825 [Ferruginibacter sp.]
MRFILFIIMYVIFISCNDMETDKKPNGHKQSDATTRPAKLLLERPTYSLIYPGNWTIDSSSKLYDIDGHFTLHSPVESGLITFFIFNIANDERETLQDHINAQLEKTIKHGEVSYFTQWGNYKGHGAIIRGKMSGVWKAELKIFVYSTGSNSFLITSIYAEGYKDDILPGLKIIESSFKLKAD